MEPLTIFLLVLAGLLFISSVTLIAYLQEGPAIITGIFCVFCLAFAFAPSGILEEDKFEYQVEKIKAYQKEDN